MAELQCHGCGAAVTVGSPIPRDAECESCGRDLRCCTNCRHYDPAYHNACRETMAEPVEDKQRRNFCEYFSFNPEPFRGAGRARDRSADARARLDDLFRKPAPEEDAPGGG
jgi:hypothetical protein